MVHFAPLQQRGESNSPYSIYDQMIFDPECFPRGEQDIADLIRGMEQEHGLLGLTDIVLNHTANNSKWLEAHPEAGYNVETAPWMESALELDSALLEYGEQLESLGLPTVFSSMDDLSRVVDGVKEHVINKIALWEYFVMDVLNDAQASVDAWRTGKVKEPASGSVACEQVGSHNELKQWSLFEKANFLKKNGLKNGLRIDGRFSRSVDPLVGAAMLTALLGPYHNGVDIDQARQTMTDILSELNLPFYREYDSDVVVILDQVQGRLKYMRLDEDGPKLGPVTKESPLIESYFSRLPLNDTTKKHNPKALALVNNGWIWAADALKDNAGPDWRPYLRREIIPWSDCVKLRYGDGPDDNPFLWEFMGRYVRLMAKYFAAFRIDNCHSTPLHVAEYFLDQARNVRPNLAVFAELFTGNEQTDYAFVKRLGLNALIREAMQAWSTQELSRIVHKHGGRPIGSFEINVIADEQSCIDAAQLNGEQPPRQQTIQQIPETPVHALFMDCTHDNQLPAQKRDARDTLPNAALVSMCACATGSVMGYDEIYPRLVEIVHETRQYSSPYSEYGVSLNGREGGIGAIKQILNQIHISMGNDGYDETYLHHEGEFITLHRLHPDTRHGYFLIAHTAFPGCGADGTALSPVHLPNTDAKAVGAWLLVVDASDKAKAEAETDKQYIIGLPARIQQIEGISIEARDDGCVISVPKSFSPGSIALFETSLISAQHSKGLGKYIMSGADAAFMDLTLTDLNFVLYRSDAEERDWSGGKDGVYVVPGHGPLVYAGLQGWWSVLENVVKFNELGHQLCNHLREGGWALDYIVGRMEKFSDRDGFHRLSKPTSWLKERFDAIRLLPSFLLPRYFAWVVQVAYNAAWRRGIRQLGTNIQQGQKFLQSLAMVSLQQAGLVKSASLWPNKSVSCLAAGLPHFAVEWARCWGRDVFISLSGLFLCTGRFEEAREHILAFASVVKHGLVPNLLSSGALPRYNSRDSPWFMLQNIQDYTRMVPGGIAFLQANVPRRFLPYDDTWFPHTDPRAYSKHSSLEDVIQEIVQRHASGISFREYNAGPNLDMQMRPEGFQIDVHVDWDTGLVFGGNQFNCGTWMDKMGESEKAGNKGIPGTPRDGAAIEINGLAYSAIAWIASLHQEGRYKYPGVKDAQGQTIHFADWAAKIKANFERCYYVPCEPKDDTRFDVKPEIVNRRGIYKDIYRSGKEYEDYQLRCNFPIAMTVAPELFTPEYARKALSIADEVLRGPMGMATLDPSDCNYRPYYNNSEDSADFATSKGRNYHCGPEWLWPTGFFLRAFLKFELMRPDSLEQRVEALQQIEQRLKGCKTAIKESPWKGLAELTNRDGSYCGDSVSLLLSH